MREQRVISLPAIEVSDFDVDAELIRKSVGLSNFSATMRYLVKQRADEVRKQ